MRLLLAALSPSGPAARLSVLIFHRVLPQPDPLFPHEMHAARFDAVLGWLKRNFNILPLAEAHARLVHGTLPARALSLTFDDGYADNAEIALPLLARHGADATFFIATGFLDGGVMWNDRIIEAVRGTRADSIDFGSLGVPGAERLPTATLQDKRAAIDAVLPAVKHLPPQRRLDTADRIGCEVGAGAPPASMMSAAQVQQLHRAGQTIGAHTVNHPILAVLPEPQARTEIVASRERLEQLIQARVGLFAYPNGRPLHDYSAESVRIVRAAGFDAAVSTAKGVATQHSDPFQIPRFTPWDQGLTKFGLRLAANLRSAVPQSVRMAL